MANAYDADEHPRQGPSARAARISMTTFTRWGTATVDPRSVVRTGTSSQQALVADRRFDHRPPDQARSA
ncbi:MAG: hypothetical protein M0032_05520 [Actinomycetota bacterium]|nr:hypothetical protein [Actinomycetota bacterium]